MKGLKEVCNNMGVGAEHWHETDNTNADGKLWRDDGGVRGDARASKPTIADNLLLATLSPDSYTYTKSIGGASRQWTLAKGSSLHWNHQQLFMGLNLVIEFSWKDPTNHKINTAHIPRKLCCHHKLEQHGYIFTWGVSSWAETTAWVGLHSCMWITDWNRL